MKQMQGLIAQFARDMNWAKNKKRVIPQENLVFFPRAKQFSNVKILKGSQHTANPNTIAIAIFNTFCSLFMRCCPPVTDCSPGLVCDLSFKTMIE